MSYNLIFMYVMLPPRRGDRAQGPAFFVKGPDQRASLKIDYTNLKGYV